MEKVGLLGAGYIASHHIKALKSIPTVQVRAICDKDLHQAQRLADGACPVYDDLDEMLRSEALDVVHVLVPPDHHFSASQQILDKGCHLFLEKPMCATEQECQTLQALAEKSHLKIGVNHNFLFFPAYLKLKEALAQGIIGPIDHITLTWQKSLEQLHRGPFGIWMLREPENPFLEVSPHLTACLLDLVGEPDKLWAEASNPLTLPNGRRVFRRWMVVGQVGKICVELRVSLVDGFPEHSLEVRGYAGSAKVDFEKNTCVLKRPTANSRPFDLFHQCRSESSQLSRQGWQGLRQYVLAKAGIRNFGDPYAESIALNIQQFYKQLHGTDDPRQSPEFGKKVVALNERIVHQNRLKTSSKQGNVSHLTSKKSPEILILGGSGFIGQSLVEHFLQKGQAVRLLVRSPERFEGSIHDKMEIIQGDILDKATLNQAMQGMKTVYHLARAQANTWQEYRERGVSATQAIGEACLENRVQRLIYTGTIDSYFAGAKGEIITENTPLDLKIKARNYYAQSKAEEERLLGLMRREKGLPVVILRPGIVIGKGSSPFHWGVGMWYYGALCQLWGEGRHPLPFVLVDDVAQGLVQAMDKPHIEGESFNLVDAPLLTAQEYVDALREVLGTQIEMIPTSIWQFYAYDCLKWIAKCAIGQKNRKLPSFRDWASRAQWATFDCTKAKRQLDWQPAGSRRKLVEEGVHKAVREWMT